MPGFDATGPGGMGPGGMGPGTGWGRGPCGGRRQRGFARGFGQGRWGYGPSPGFRGGARWGCRFPAPYAWGGRSGTGYEQPEDEARHLMERRMMLEQELEGIRTRLAELETRT